MRMRPHPSVLQTLAQEPEIHACEIAQRWRIFIPVYHPHMRLRQLHPRRHLLALPFEQHECDRSRPVHGFGYVAPAAIRRRGVEGVVYTLASCLLDGGFDVLDHGCAAVAVVDYAVAEGGGEEGADVGGAGTADGDDGVDF